MKKIIVLHESGARSHYRALVDDSALVVEFYEFAIAKLVVKSIYTKNLKLFLKQVSNLLFLIRLPFLKDRVVVLGMAPFDYRVVFFLWLTRRNDIIYHSSWPEWNTNFYPKRLLAPLVKGLWKKFLLGCRGLACVSNETKQQIQCFCGIDHERVWVVNHAIARAFVAMDVRFPREEACLFVGRIEEGKGVDRVFLLAQILSNMKFYLAGEIRGNLKIPALPNVIYLGYIRGERDLADMYDRCSFLLLPSKRTKTWQELFGLVIIEAMQRGCIPLCTDHVGPQEILGKKFPCLLFTEENYVQGVKSFIEMHLVEVRKIRELGNMLANASNKFKSESIRRLWKL